MCRCCLPSVRSDASILVTETFTCVTARQCLVVWLKPTSGLDWLGLIWKAMECV